VATFPQRLPLYSLRDSIEIEQKFWIYFYEKSRKNQKYKPICRRYRSHPCVIVQSGRKIPETERKNMIQSTYSPNQGCHLFRFFSVIIESIVMNHNLWFTYTVCHHSYSLLHQLGRRPVKVFFYGREAPLSFLIREVKTSATI
jgi:hypothetical protein